MMRQQRINRTVSRLTAFALAVCVCLVLLPMTARAVVVDSGNCGDPAVNGGADVTWSLDDTGKLSISGAGAMANYLTAAMVPWFSHRTDITLVVIDDDVTSIGSNVFNGCTVLTSFTIPGNVIKIGSYAFSGCTSLKNVTIPNSVTDIGNGAFNGCKGLTSVNLPSSVINIGDHAFSSCTGLKNVTIPNSVTTIGANAFYNCTSLANIVIPDSVKTIGNSAFNRCTGLISVAIPRNVTTIKPSTFDGCTSLTSVTIPDSVTTIDMFAFNNCTSLASVTIPSNVKTIDVGAFSGCKALASVTFAGTAPPTISTEYPSFMDAHSTGVVYYPEGEDAAYSGILAAMGLVSGWTVETFSPPPPTHTLTVTAGTGGSVSGDDSGTYAVDEPLSVTATAQTEYTFVSWTASGISVANTPTIHFNMPNNDVTLTANFAYAGNGGNGGNTGNTTTPTVTPAPTTPATAYYTVSVNGSYAGTTGVGSYRAGNTVTIHAGSRSGYSFNGWATISSGVVFANVSSATTTFTMPANNVTVRANWSENGGGSGSGSTNGGNGSSNGSVYAPPAAIFITGGVYNPTTTTAPMTPSTHATSTTLSTPTTLSSPPAATDRKSEQPTMASQDCTATVDKNGNAFIAIVEAQIKKLIDTATANAAKSGKASDGIGVQLNILFGASGKSVSVQLTRAALALLEKEGVKRFDINTPLVCFSLDWEAIQEANAQTAGNVTFKAVPVSDLSDAAADLIGDRPVYDITLRYQQNGNTAYITDFKKGTIALGIPYKAVSGEKTGNLHGVYVDRNGKPQLLTQSSYGNGKVALRRNSLSIYGVGYNAASPTFTDTANHWAKANIDFVVSRGLISGASTTKFAPDTAITRADFMMALGKLSGTNVSGYKTSRFTDVSAASDPMPYIEWAVAKKIASETSSGKFSPESPITREDMAVMMQNYAKATGYALPVSRQAVTFADDAKISADAKNAVQALQQTGVISSKANNLFDPQRNVTRAQAATILRRFVALVIDESTARGWVQNDVGQWQYINSAGKAVANNWITVGAHRYYFDSHGIRVSGKWMQIGANWYYFQADGKRATNTTIDGQRVGADGARID